MKTSNLVLKQRRIASWLCLLFLYQTSLGFSQVTETLTYHIVDLTTIQPYLPQRLLPNGLHQITDTLKCARKSQQTDLNSRGFLYNDKTHVCTPLLWLEGLQSSDPQPAQEDEGDLYLAFSCAENFRIHEYGANGSLTCIQKSTEELTYQAATAVCNTWGGHLATVRTVAKLELIKAIAGNDYVWLGADDLEVEGKIIWQVDQQELTSQEIADVFGAGEPSYAGNEHCIHYRVYTKMLNDADCTDSHKFICEIVVPSAAT